MPRPGFDPGPLQVASQIGPAGTVAQKALLAHLATETGRLLGCKDRVLVPVQLLAGRIISEMI